MATVRLADYRPAPFTIEHTQLLFQLHADHTVVDAAFQLVPAGAASAAPWEFLGEQLELLSIELDGEPLPAEAYRLEPGKLVLLAPPEAACCLRTRKRLSRSGRSGWKVIRRKPSASHWVVKRPPLT